MENQKQSYLGVWIIVAIIVIVSFVLILNKKGDVVTTENSETSSTTDNTVPVSSMAIRPYGEATLKIGETANFKGVSITAVKVTEDSRCPVGVQCIQAGTVKVIVKSLLDGGSTKESTVSLGSSVTVDTFSIALKSVIPATKSNVKIKDADYRLTFSVNQSSVEDSELKGK